MKNNNFLKNLIDRALEKKASIILPETNDKRINDAIQELKKLGFNILDVNDFSEDDKYIEYILQKKFSENWPKSEIVKYLQTPLNKAMAILACNEVDAVVAGASTSTANVLRSALRIVGIDPNYKWVSSSFLMLSPNQENIYTYSDCAVIPEPNPEQLALIAKASSDLHYLITNQEPKVAFLSFSTNQSASHYRVDRVQQAVNIFARKFPEIIHEGEIQFDAAISSSVAERKNKQTKLNGEANVFIFPNLDAGNISYKITRQLAGYDALGPLLQGLSLPVHDLSRSCSVNDIINVVAIASIQKPI